MLRGLLLALLIIPASGLVRADYFPPRGEWARQSPEAAGFDPTSLEAAIAFAQASETSLPEPLNQYVDVRDLPTVRSMYPFTREPFDEVIGPMAPRGPFSGMVIRNGYIVAEWGDNQRADMTNSITKTFLSSVAGLAFDRGLLPSVHEPAGERVDAGLFDGPHNSRITWDHLLRQTSFWRGTLWGKPDWADRPGEHPWSEYARETPAPGTEYKYNDVRVNVLALALLHLWREPLPEVLRQHIMDPIGASGSWRWHGYRNSWVELDGQRMQSVSGGGHWGGGMFISGRDLGRLGLLALNRGRWGERQILSEEWIAMSRTPGEANPNYGYMNYFLNTDQTDLPDLPADSYYFAGAGANIVWIDESRDLVIVLRWVDSRALNDVLKNFVAAME